MKYFKNIPTYKINERPGWDRIVEIFTPKDAKAETAKSSYVTSFRQFISDLQNSHMQKQIEENKRLMKQSNSGRKLK